ncbi:MAG: hypothetical protein CFE21_02950 [Bacteroidetes bacterium B1(2017)]|nr:MAG: hypothetical protein CFE21_02950 [Bacteroidetes bacterium B1(2017)]
MKYRKTMPVFLDLAAGINSSKFIDFGTSPLYYKGSLMAFYIGLRKETVKREITYTGFYSFGNYFMNYNRISSASSGISNVSIRHSRLYQVNAFSNKLYNLKVGGSIDMTELMRINESLLNNQFGFDMFFNVMGSVKISKNISNLNTKRIWFIKIKPKDRKISYQIDCGILNATYRNNFIYSNSTAVYNGAKLFGSHNLNLFSGFRMSSRLNYEHTIFGNNSLKYSYIWDAMMTGKDKQDRMQLANNYLLVSLNIKFR